MAAARPGLAIFLAAKAASDVGYALDFVCLSVFVWERTGSALATGLVSVALYAGAILGGQAGNRYGRAWNRRGVMIGADALRMAVLVVLAVLPAGAQLAWLYPVVFFLGVGRSVFEGTLAAATPVLAGPRVQTVNSLLAGLKGIAFVVGMGAATVVVPVLGYRGVFALDAGTYALSGVVLCALRLPLREAAPVPPAAAGAADRGSGRPTWPLLVLTAVAPLVVLRGFDAFGSSSQQVGLPILGSRLRPDAPELFAGTMWSVWAVGLFLAGFVLRPMATQVVARAPARVFCLSTIVMSLGFIGVFWLPGWWPRLLAALVAGVGDAFSEITFKQALQQLPDEERGQAFGFCQIVVNGGLMAGLAVTSVALTPDLAARWVLLLHGLPILLAGWLVLTSQPGRRLQEQQEQEQPT
ncbi:MFS transporter [Streptomyces sp. H39-S7]|uniref:MFS transporter n=1 Tax=Streptomyces sp. H39-S7 TaxID=3004357 RepID=UPI0022AFF521|nr:MFS transporter [Streptomyces sp. H39-S7]MCZ4121085.1 MFS transporter [Streptomyces sp. H39-S7]